MKTWAEFFMSAAMVAMAMFCAYKAGRGKTSIRRLSEDERDAFDRAACQFELDGSDYYAELLRNLKDMLVAKQ